MQRVMPPSRSIAGSLAIVTGVTQWVESGLAVRNT